jgi:hypothetical protein
VNGPGLDRDFVRIFDGRASESPGRRLARSRGFGIEEVEGLGVALEEVQPPETRHVLALRLADAELLLDLTGRLPFEEGQIDDLAVDVAEVLREAFDFLIEGRLEVGEVDVVLGARAEVRELFDQARGVAASR